MPRPVNKKARVFNLSKRKPAPTEQTPAAASSPTPAAPRSAPLPAKAPSLVLELYDSESGYVIGAIMDAQRSASASQAACERVGNLQQSVVFAQKAATLYDIADRITKAFATRNK